MIPNKFRFHGYDVFGSDSKAVTKVHNLHNMAVILMRKDFHLAARFREEAKRHDPQQSSLVDIPPSLVSKNIS